MTALGGIVTIAATAAVSLAYFLFATAPVGYETEDGWFPGEPPIHTDYDGDP